MSIIEHTSLSITDFFKSLQNDICTSLELTDGKSKFREDAWERPGGGGGLSRIITNGNIFEKGGVNYSAVFGKTPEIIAKSFDLPEKSEFYATGLSIVIHPFNPHIPIIHSNIRYFELDNGVKWFGGGIDLTPIYIIEDDARFFHQSLKHVCDSFSPDYYPRFRKWADDYFYITHRKETRGIGGIFFDRLREDENCTFANRFEFVKQVGNCFVPVYTEIVKRNHYRNYNDKEKQWQLLRRGRYVEFNLIYDKGTRFGLDTDGRVESILMSLPAVAGWEYNYVPKKGSAEEKTLKLLRKDVQWSYEL